MSLLSTPDALERHQQIGREPEARLTEEDGWSRVRPRSVRGVVKAGEPLQEPVELRRVLKVAHLQLGLDKPRLRVDVGRPCRGQDVERDLRDLEERRIGQDSVGARDLRSLSLEVERQARAFALRADLFLESLP